MGNILFITADQWRGECLSHLGHMVQTPNLDALAREGVSFVNHFANTAPCGPSRASLHTGMYLMNHRSATNGTPLDARHDNWALALRRAGRDPVVLGYTDTAQDPREYAADDPVLRTYEGLLPGIRCVADMGEHPNAWAAWLRDKGYEIPDPNWRLYTTKQAGSEYEDGGDAPLPLAVPAEHHDTWFMVDTCIEHIAEHLRAGRGAWHVHLSLTRPHPPWVAPAPYNAMYAPAEVPPPRRADDPAAEGRQHPYLAWQLAQRRWAAPADARKLHRLKATYYGLMSEVDANLGRLFDYLRRSGQWDDTLIVFTSDHGEQMGDHWLLGKCGYFDASYRIPLIVRDPRAGADATRGTRFNGFTENVDIAPTLLDWESLPIPVQCDGASLLPVLSAGRVPTGWRRAAHWEYDFRDVVGAGPERALGITQHQCTLNVLRSDRYKYVHFAALAPLLFDLEADPDETTNLAADPAHRETLLDCAQALLSWRMNHDEQTLTHVKLTAEGVQAREAPRY